MHADNHVILDMEIGNALHIHNGEFTLKCSEPVVVDKLKAIAVKELSSKYDIHHLKSSHTHVRFVSMSECYEEET